MKLYTQMGLVLALVLVGQQLDASTCKDCTQQQPIAPNGLKQKPVAKEELEKAKAANAPSSQKDAPQVSSCKNEVQEKAATTETAKEDANLDEVLSGSESAEKDAFEEFSEADLQLLEEALRELSKE